MFICDSKVKSKYPVCEIVRSYHLSRVIPLFCYFNNVQGLNNWELEWNLEEGVELVMFRFLWSWQQGMHNWWSTCHPCRTQILSLQCVAISPHIAGTASNVRYYVSYFISQITLHITFYHTKPGPFPTPLQIKSKNSNSFDIRDVIGIGTSAFTSSVQDIDNCQEHPWCY